MIEYVNHPKHYNVPGRKECILELEEKYGTEITATFCLTNCYRYLYRAGEKIDNPKKQDIDKAKWYFRYAEKLAEKEKLPYLGNLRLWVDIKMELEKYDE